LTKRSPSIGESRLTSRRSTPSPGDASADERDHHPLETDEQVKVVAFDSAVEGFFLIHLDFLQTSTI